LSTEERKVELKFETNLVRTVNMRTSEKKKDQMSQGHTLTACCVYSEAMKDDICVDWPGEILPQFGAVREGWSIKYVLDSQCCFMPRPHKPQLSSCVIKCDGGDLGSNHCSPFHPCIATGFRRYAMRAYLEACHIFE
jgi:hypothetical protein